MLLKEKTKKLCNKINKLKRKKETFKTSQSVRIYFLIKASSIKLKFCDFLDKIIVSRRLKPFKEITLSR